MLVGIDYSECSDNALKEASRIANARNCCLICYHVLEELAIEDMERMVEIDRDQIQKESLKRLEKHVADTVGAGHDIQCRVTIGYPFDEFIKVINDESATSLVIGSRGHCQSNSSRTGAFASRCVRKAPTEVLLVRGHQNEPFRRITACVDLSDTSKKALDRAHELAVQDKAALEVIHVAESPILFADGMGGLGPALPPPNIDAMVDAAKKKLAEFVAKAIPADNPIQPTQKVLCAGSAGAALVEHLNEHNSDLAVLGTKGRTGILGFFLGTTAERIIHEAPCSTLAIKPDGFKYP